MLRETLLLELGGTYKGAERLGPWGEEFGSKFSENVEKSSECRLGSTSRNSEILPDQDPVFEYM